MHRSSKRGSALVITFVVLVLLAGIVVGMFEVSNVTSRNAIIYSDIQALEQMTEVGIHHYIHQITSLHGQGVSAKDIVDNHLIPHHVDRMKNFGTQGGFFVLKSAEYVGEHHIKLELWAGYPQTPLLSQIGSSLLPSAYAGGIDHQFFVDNQLYHSRCEIVVGPMTLTAGGLGIATNLFDLYGTNNQIHVIGGGDAKIVSPSLTHLKNGLDSGQMVIPQLSWEDEGFIPGDPHAGKVFLSNQVLEQDYKTLANDKVNSAVTLLNQKMAGATPLTGLGTANGGGVQKISHGNWDFSGKSTVYNTDHGGRATNSLNRTMVNHSDYRDVVLGHPNHFSAMKFKNFRFYGNSKTIRFNPGIYYFDKFRAVGDDQKILFDTTHGPVILVVEQDFHLMGERGGVFIFKHENTGNYSDTGIVGASELHDEGYEKRTDYLNQQEAWESSNPMSGKKIASIYLMEKQPLHNKPDILLTSYSPSGETKTYSANQKVIGGFVVGHGNNNGIPTINVNGGKGTEVEKDSTTNRWKLQSGVTTPTTDHFRVWGAGQGVTSDGEVEVDYGITGTIFMGNIIGPGMEEVDINGDNNQWYGNVICRKWEFHGSNSQIHIDSRIDPFRSSPLLGTYQIKYKRYLE